MEVRRGEVEARDGERAGGVVVGRDQGAGVGGGGSRRGGAWSEFEATPVGPGASRSKLRGQKFWVVAQPRPKRSRELLLGIRRTVEPESPERAASAWSSSSERTP